MTRSKSKTAGSGRSSTSAARRPGAPEKPVARAKRLTPTQVEKFRALQRKIDGDLAAKHAPGSDADLTRSPSQKA